MRFEIKPPFVLVHDDKPGSHVTLFGTHARFGKGVVRYPFNSEHSSFNDTASQYTWAFEASPADGEILVCATSDREVVVEVRPLLSVGCDVAAREQHPFGLRVYRVADAGNKPLTLVGGAR